MYNISFEMIGFCLALIIILIQFFLFDTKQRASKIFLYYLIFVALECALDVFTAIGIEGRIQVSDTANLWLHTAYLIVAIMSAVLAYGLIEERLNYKKKALGYIILFLFILETGSILANTIFGYYFRFENGQYIKTSMFFAYYLFLIVCFIFILWIYIAKRKELFRREGVASILFMLVVLITLVIQAHLPNILLTGFGKMLAALAFLILLETPEHMRLRNAVTDLQRAQQEEKRLLEELATANAKRTEFLIQVSHELRTPINAILGFNKMILDESDKNDLKEKALELQKAGDKLGDLVEEIVDFSQIETGVLDIRPREYEFVEAYLNLEKRVEHLFHEDREIGFVQLVSEDIPQRLYGDINRITQVIEKIMLYSLGNLESGNLTLKVAAEGFEQNQVKLAFYLQNIGDVKPIDFEDNPLEYETIVQILKSLNSELEVSYKEGIGVIYKFILKQEIVDLKQIGEIGAAIERYVTNRQTATVAPKFIMPEAKILVVDDTPVNLRVFDAFMQHFQIHIDTATSGREAVEIMLNKKYDLVFMDILMPKMSGEETLNCIRFTDEVLSREVPVIALTANVFSGAKDYYIEKGFADYMTKPIDMDKLADTLRTFLPEFLKEAWDSTNVTKEKPKKVLRYQDIPGLDMDVALTLCMEDMDLYTEIVREYCANHVDQELSKYYAEEDWENYRVYIHGAKSSSKTVGLVSLSEGAAELEAAVKTEDFDFVRKNHMTWIDSYLKVVDQLQQVIESR